MRQGRAARFFKRCFMSSCKILFINLGYARGIGGRLSEHIRYAYRHFYCSPAIQRQSLDQLNRLIKEEEPDLCCFVEIDQGSFGSARFNQLKHLVSENHAFSDIQNKYAPESLLRSFAVTSGKSNGFISKIKYDFERLYFTCGFKRLVYKIKLAKNTTVFFAHFSLKKSVRARQLLEARDLMRREEGEAIFLGDFNILSGLQEIEPLLDGGRFVLLNRSDVPTFLFHKRALVLDLCVCSRAISKEAFLKIVPQSYSDHAALVLEVKALPVMPLRHVRDPKLDA
jgi:endonuclease/exonuclease/phosphatase family metal-dependent hydrolase